jgi:hypothetical protein
MGLLSPILSPPEEQRENRAAVARQLRARNSRFRRPDAERLLHFAAKYGICLPDSDTDYDKGNEREGEYEQQGRAGLG